MISRRVERGLHVVTRTCPTHTESFITATAMDGEPDRAPFERLAGLIEDHQAAVVSQEVFGPVASHESCLAPFGEVAWPVTWIQEAQQAAPAVAGTQVWAVAGTPVRSLDLGGNIVGRVFFEGATQVCRLGALAPERRDRPSGDQAQEVFQQMDAALAAADMTFADVVRTWFFNHDILEWYSDFNRVRQAFFEAHEVFDGLVPASTGMGGCNGSAAALTGALLALRSEDKRVRAEAVPSPLQSPALEYGSAFSRAVEVAMPDHRRLFVSGTASISPEGDTLHVGDVDAQIARTMDVARAILESRGMGWHDVTRAIVYFKRAADRPRFAAYAAQRGLPPLPVVVVANDVCRDDLLFEIELDALRASAGHGEGQC